MLKFKEVEVEDLIKGLGNVLQYRLVVEYLACTNKTKKLKGIGRKKEGQEGGRKDGREGRQSKEKKKIF